MKYLPFSQTKSGSNDLLCAHGWAWQAQLLFFWRRISQSEIRNSAVAEKSESESEGGQKFLPPDPLPFCPPERSVSAAQSAAISRSFVQKRFELRSVNATIQDFLKIWKRLCARSAPQGWGYARIFPYISGLNQRVGEARTGLFCPAFGGSWWQSHRSKNISLKEVMKCFCFPIFSASCRRQENKASFNPALFPPKAQWPKATIINLTEQTL